MPTLQLEEREIKKTDIYYAPCIKCGGENIVFGDAGESSFNYASGECQTKGCKHRVFMDCDTFHKKKDIIAGWNRENDIDKIQKRKAAQVEELLNKTIPELKAQIKGLERLKRGREKERAKGKGIAPLKLSGSSGGNYGEPKVNKYELGENVYLVINEKHGDVI